MNLAYGADDVWAAAICGPPSRGEISFLQQQFTNVKTALTDAGREFMEHSRKLYDHFAGSAAMEFARTALRQSGVTANVNYILPLNTLEELRAAPPIMQQYIMACPSIRRDYHDQRADGYSNTYHDTEPNYIGVDHYHYRRATSGIAEIHEDGNYTLVIHSEELDETIHEPTLDEKIDIQHSWRVAEAIRKVLREDVTQQDAPLS